MKVVKVRSKPVDKEAMQWTVDVEAEFALERWGCEFTNGRNPDYLHIKTLEGSIIASPFDWIVKGVNGEFYPVKPDIFAKTYEVIE